ncbi:hypothetical protein NIES21_07150 [Anabaenopsis circularis NIES-21]|uniref:Uncharacterized protein n=1 Tax=Anabaenopsis circularis NIES-21 TaxID=1085406 RepID=A0A1Z4GBS4_9CYAN|nr:hypothetical protein NIES21_07150 [Anabaenopsis circularis NIES-21]
MEVFSQIYNGEYEQKKIDYAEIRYFVLYYLCANAIRRKRQRLEVYRLVEGKYILQQGDEIGLSIGRKQVLIKEEHENGYFGMKKMAIETKLQQNNYKIY